MIIRNSIMVRAIAASILSVACFTGSRWSYGQESSASGWTNYFLLAVQDGMNLPAPTNATVYHGVNASIGQTMSRQGYLRKYSSTYPVAGRSILVNSTEWEVLRGVHNKRVRISIIEGENGHNGVMDALCTLMSNHTSMGGPVYELMKGGPGDVCLRFRRQSGRVDDEPSILFFCRGNVAVQVLAMSFHGSVMPIARLVDTAIKASVVQSDLREGRYE